MMIPAVAVAAAAALGTCIGFPPGDMTDPHYWGDYFLTKYKAEREEAIANIEAGPPKITKPRTILLITGVTIPGEWFDPIKLRLERDGFKTVVYEPPGLLSGDLFENSRALGDVIDGIRAQTGEAKIDILAECTGGLIARHYIQALGGDKYVGRMVTFISPEHGVPKAAEAALIAGWPALHDLTPGSTFLRTVNSAKLPSTVAFTSIYSCTDEYIQPYETSVIPGAKNIAIGCNGTFIGHYQFFYDREIYRLMHDQLVGPEDFVTPPSDPGDDDPAGQPDEADVKEGGGCRTAGGSPLAGLLVIGALLATRRGTRRPVAR
jgi:triacylglycerol lipase